MGWNRKERRGHKKGGGKQGQGVGSLKEGGWKSLTNYGWRLCHIHFFRNFLKNFRSSCVTLKETTGLLKDLIRSALNSVIDKICKFKNF